MVLVSFLFSNTAQMLMEELIKYHLEPLTTKSEFYLFYEVLLLLELSYLQYLYSNMINIIIIIFSSATCPKSFCKTAIKKTIKINTKKYGESSNKSPKR